MKNKLKILLFILLLLTGCMNKKTAMSPERTETSSEIRYVEITYSDTEKTLDSVSYPSVEYSMDLTSEESEPLLLNELTVSQSPINNVKKTDGTLVYQVDTIFTIDVTSRVEARIIRKIYDTIPRNVIEMFHISSNGVVKKEYIQTSEIMDVNLISLDPDAFRINKINNEQIVDENTLTEWIWGVTPKKIGNFNLILKVSIKNNNVIKDKIIFDKIINVENKLKKNYNYIIDRPFTLKNNDENVIKIIIKEVDNKDSASFNWYGKGDIVLDFDDITEFKIVKIGDNMVDGKKVMTCNWVITPDTDFDLSHYNIKIKNEYEEIIIYDEYIDISKNIGYDFNNFIDITLKRWYWLFSVLLIPIYGYIKKKYFSKKENI